MGGDGCLHQAPKEKLARDKRKNVPMLRGGARFKYQIAKPQKKVLSTQRKRNVKGGRSSGAKEGSQSMSIPSCSNSGTNFAWRNCFLDKVNLLK